MEDQDRVANLTKGMEHMRPYVSVQPTARLSPSPSTNNETTSNDPSLDPSHTTYGVPSTLIKPARLPANTRPTQDNPQKRTDPFQFGSRYLEEGDDIFAHNAWDHVQLDDDFRAFAETQYAAQRAAPVSEADRQRFCDRPEKMWDRFYARNEEKFFKDRKWLFQEFPVLREVTAEGRGDVRVLEVGAGAGNTAFPVLRENRNEGLMVHACDYSATAVEVMRKSELFDEKHMRADVWDAAATSGEDRQGISLPPGLDEESVDVVIMIFIFSALSPSQWTQALRNIYALLKPGGLVLFRDYGRGDLAQVRFKKGRWLEENFYARGDGTRVYFFDEEELKRIWSGESPATEYKDGIESTEDPLKRPTFEILDLGTDRRLLVNRKRHLKMYRCWMQGRFRKPESKHVETTTGTAGT